MGKALFSTIYLLILALSFACKNSQKDPVKKPNVLLIFTDQQNVNMMSAAGNPYLQTPAMDNLVSKGVMFTQSYCTSPVCAPARSSIISGKMPHETGVEWNGDEMREDILNAGDIFRNAGYKTIWAGKWHLPESYPQRAASKQKEIRGFDLLPFWNPENKTWMLGAETDPPLTEAVVNFLKDHDKEQPFFLAVSYHNPHDICFYARKDGWFAEGDSLLEIRYYGFEYRLPDVIGTHPDQVENLPPFPSNFAIDPNEPEFIQQKRAFHNEYGLETKLANQEFTEKEWRGYYYAYCRLTEMVDIEIGKLLKALEDYGFDKNTIIVFTSDHGDGAASHKWAAKLSLYEESSKIPLIISWNNKIQAGKTDNSHLVSQIDILPTLCDYAGINSSAQFTGKSFRPIIENENADWRSYLVVELADFKPDSLRKGRMIRSADYKYNVYSLGMNNEQFFDLKNDPGETLNLINDSTYQDEIYRHKMQLKEWISQSNDTFGY